MIYRKRRTDHNQKLIAGALRKAGWHITDLSGCGAGVPDLLITKNNTAYLVEIKNKAGRNRFTDAQVQYYTECQALIYVMRSLTDVEEWLSGKREAINAAS